MKEVGKGICILHNQIHRHMESLREQDGLPRAQGRMLGYIASKCNVGEVYQKDVELEFNLRRASASETLAKLESMDLIDRISSEKDKRIKKIQITEKGKAYVKQVHLNIQNMEEILKMNLSEEELTMFYRVIGKMIENCERQKDKKGEIV